MEMIFNNLIRKETLPIHPSANDSKCIQPILLPRASG